MAGLMVGYPKCNVTGKEMLPDKKTARDMLAAYAIRRGSRRAFWCIFCEKYHLTKGVRGKPGRGK